MGVSARDGWRASSVVSVMPCGFLRSSAGVAGLTALKMGLRFIYVLVEPFANQC